jgi:hypothetical protein
VALAEKREIIPAISFQLNPTAIRNATAPDDAALDNTSTDRRKNTRAEPTEEGKIQRAGVFFGGF